MAKRYYNPVKDVEYRAGEALTWRLANGGGLWSGVPSEERLAEFGFVEVEDAVAAEPSESDRAASRMAEIEAELQSMDYLTSKYVDGEDMSEYGDWQGRRRELREEYRRLEERV